MSQEDTLLEILILGNGEIARTVARLADGLGHDITVCEPDINPHDFPACSHIRNGVYADKPWDLPPYTHAIIARGHEGDAESVLALLTHGVTHAYLIASARRAVGIIDNVRDKLGDPCALERLSAPAGLDLGGRSSGGIALSLLAEIQWRHQGCQGALRPLTERREERAARPATVTDDRECPGKRP